MPSSFLPRPLRLVTGVFAAAALVAGPALAANADPIALSATAAASAVVLPIGDGYHDEESLVVTASADATATVTLQRAGGGSTVVAQDLPLVAGPNPVRVPTAGLVAGDYTATVATTDGASAVATFAVQPLVATLSKLTVQRSLSTVFPAKDGYRDAVVFTVQPTVEGPASAEVTGTAKVTRAGRTAKSWKLHSGTNRLTWNGKAGSAVKPGRYTLTVSAKGPHGAAKTVRSSVTVSPKRLVTRTVVSTEDASSVLTRIGRYDGGAEDCGYLGAFILCRSGTAQDGAPYAVIVGGTTSVPKAVRSSRAYGKPELRIGLRTTKLTGSGTWGYGVGTAHTTRGLAKGTTTGKWIRWADARPTTTIYVGLGDGTKLAVDRFTFTYRYRALV